VRWSNTESRRVDTKALKAKYPKIAEECVKVTKGRRFTVSRVEEEDG
jgi:predicted phage-related endonuclease